MLFSEETVRLLLYWLTLTAQTVTATSPLSNDMTIEQVNVTQSELASLSISNSSSRSVVASSASSSSILGGTGTIQCSAQEYGTPNLASCMMTLEEMGTSTRHFTYADREGRLSEGDQAMPLRYVSCKLLREIATSTIFDTGAADGLCIIEIALDSAAVFEHATPLHLHLAADRLIKSCLQGPIQQGGRTIGLGRRQSWWSSHVGLKLGRIWLVLMYLSGENGHLTLILRENQPNAQCSDPRPGVRPAIWPDCQVLLDYHIRASTTLQVFGHEHSPAVQVFLPFVQADGKLQLLRQNVN